MGTEKTQSSLHPLGLKIRRVKERSLKDESMWVSVMLSFWAAWRQGHLLLFSQWQPVGCL